jgi:hypothetical protein
MWAVLLSYLGNGGNVLLLKSCLTIVTWLRVFAICGRCSWKVPTNEFFFFINRAWLNQNSMSIKTSLTKLTINFNMT